MGLETTRRRCTSLPSSSPRSTAVVASLQSVLLGSGWRLGTTTSARWPSTRSSTLSPTTGQTCRASFWLGRPISRTSWQSPTSLTRASSRSSSRPSSSRQSRWQTSHSSRRRSSSQSTLSTLPSTQTRSYGIKDTMMGLEMGAVETLIIWEDLEIDRIVLVDPASGSETIKFLNKEQQEDPTQFQDRATGVDLELKEREELIEWLANNYSSFGASLKFVTDRSQEGSQFCKGFGGVGGILRYQLDFAAMEYHSSDWDSDSDEYSSDEGGI